MLQGFIKYSVLTVLINSVLWSCDLSSDDGQDCLDGMGGSIVEPRFVGNFTSIRHRIPGSVFITQASFPSLRVEGQENLLPFLTTEVEDEILTVEFENCLNSGMPVNVYATVIDLEAVSLAGVGDIIFENDIVSPRLEASITGLGNLNLSGMANTLRIEVEGQGDAIAFDMISDKCVVEIIGQGNVEVTANMELDVLINGQGNVFYKGMPAITSEINGSGVVIDAN